MKYRKKIFETPSFIELTINSWKYNLDGADKEVVPEEAMYNVGIEHEGFIQKCCVEFKERFQKELVYEFRNEIFYLRYADNVLAVKKLFTLTDINLTIEQKENLSKKFEILMEKYFRFSLKNGKGSEYFEGVAEGLNAAHKIINGVEDDYIYK